MKTILFLLVILSCGFPVFSQIDTKKLDFNNKLEISLEKAPAGKSLKQMFRSVDVIDVRDDTTAVGFYSVSKGEAIKYMIKSTSAVKDKDTDPWSRIYHCQPSFQDAMKQWMNEYLQCRNTDSIRNKLLVVVKKMWLSYQAEKPRFDNTGVSAAVDGWDAGVLCKLEFYLERENIFYPLYRIDSVFTFKDPLYDYAGFRFIDNGASFLTVALKHSLDKLFDTDLDEITARRRKLSITDIEREYSKRKDIPILRDNVLKKGVYTSYDEFKNNSPSISIYEFKTGPLGDILFVKEGGQEYPTRTAWGYCDGINIFINSGDKYSRLTREANAFYFYGIKEIARRSKIRFVKASPLNYASNSGEKKSVFKMNLKYLMLDMESGEAY